MSVNGDRSGEVLDRGAYRLEQRDLACRSAPGDRAAAEVEQVAQHGILADHARLQRLQDVARLAECAGSRIDENARLPHNVVVDGQSRVYVTDRDNQRIQIFDANGKYLSEWSKTGGVSGLAMTGDGRMITGAVVRDLSGNVVVKLPEAQAAHGAAIDAAGSIYLAQLSGIVQKYVKQ